MKNEELVERLKQAVELIKDSGSPDATIAFPARAAAIQRLSIIIMKLSAKSCEKA